MASESERPAADAALGERCRAALAGFAAAQGCLPVRVSTRAADAPALPRSGKRQRFVRLPRGRAAG